MIRPSSWLVLLGVAALAAAVALLDIVSWDYWWHLRTGRLIWDTGAVPRIDVFSYTAEGARYVDIHWLFQLLLYGIYSLGGHTGAVLAKLGCVVLLLMLLAPIGTFVKRPIVTGASLGIVLVLCSERIMPRPDLLSFVLLAAVHRLLDRDRDRADAWLWAIVPLQILWCNLHGLFALGIALCAIHLAGEVFDWLSDGRGTRERATRLAGLTLAAMAASVVNPNGLEGSLYPLAQLGMIGSHAADTLGRDIIELQSSLAVVHPAMLFVAALLVLGTVVAGWMDRTRTPASDVLTVVAFVYLALAARRNLPLLAIATVPLLLRYLGHLLGEAKRRPGLHVELAAAGILSLVLVGLAFDVSSGRFHARLGQARQAGLGVMQTQFSTGAAAWLADHHPPGHVAHDMADGGVILQYAWPDLRVMVDGRLEVYGAERLEELQIRRPADLNRLNRRYRFGSVLVHYSKLPSAELLRFLERSPRWTLVFVDEVSALYVRSDLVRAERYAALSVDARDLFAPFEDAGRVQTEIRARGQALFYEGVGRRERALRVMRRASAMYPDIEWSADEPPA
jgi:hypothetical protein